MITFIIHFMFQAKPFHWMLDVVWLNIIELNKHEPFTQLLEKVITDYSCIKIHIKFNYLFRFLDMRKSGNNGLTQRLLRRKICL